MSFYVVDVSKWQSVSQAVQAGADATIVKATQGTDYVSASCNAQYAAAKKAGKLLGLYHYAGGGDPVAEANYFISNIKNYVGEALLVLDWEKGENSAWGSTTWARKFADRVHVLTGVWPLIYTGEEGAQQCASCAKDCGLWFAGYPYFPGTTHMYPGWSAPANFPYSTGGWKSLTMWQYTSTDGQLDRSIFYGDVAAWKKLAKPGTIITGAVSANKVTVKSNPKPVVKASTNPRTWKDSRGVIWTAESGTATLKSSVNLRWGATTSSSIIATLPAGSQIKYDAKCVSGGYIWIRQPRSGGYGYLAVGKANSAGANVDPYATFS